MHPVARRRREDRDTGPGLCIGAAPGPVSRTVKGCLTERVYLRRIGRRGGAGSRGPPSRPHLFEAHRRRAGDRTALARGHGGTGAAGRRRRHLLPSGGAGGGGHRGGGRSPRAPRRPPAGPAAGRHPPPPRAGRRGPGGLRRHGVPAARLQVGLLAYAAVLLLSRGAPAIYMSPDGVQTSEPIRLWLQLGDKAPFDPVRLYVGNVAGPVLATSMLAVAVGAAWLWYSRRLSLLVVLTFVAGALVPIAVERWSLGYQLASGPLWFVAALVLADRHMLPASGVGRPLLGFLAGALALAVRARGFAIEASVVAVAGMQALNVGLQGLDWVRHHREESAARLRDLRDGALALGRPRRPRPAD
ncbi:MAG: RnfABCDGE type electron transport complex subunit D [Chloroflexi bacterium]|nr:MAG: RnfABCDGE type electron transport complex subunit D [Chloroflexota bacterium]